MNEHWTRFLTRYSIIAVTGTAVIYLAAPGLEVPPPSSVLNAEREVIIATPPAPHENETQPDDNGQDNPDINTEDQPPADDGDNIEKEPEDSDPFKEPEPEPEKKGMWGITKNPATPVYSTKGKFISKVGTGIFVDISKTTRTKKGTLAVCKLKSGKVVLMKAGDLIFFKGALEDADPARKLLLSKKYKLIAEIDERTKALLKEINKSNPHKKALDDINAEYKLFWKKVQDLQAKRDAASDGDHMKFNDELRQMKGEDIRLAEKKKAIEKQYVDWRDQHAPSASSDQTISKLNIELAEIEQQILTAEK